MMMGNGHSYPAQPRHHQQTPRRTRDHAHCQVTARQLLVGRNHPGVESKLFDFVSS